MEKILIVDDNKEYLRIAMNYIIEESAPYAMLGAPNGKIALEIAKSELPSIIIMDWEMPEKDGIQTIRELKKDSSTKDIPVIIATGIRLTPDDLKVAFDAGASDFLRKPLEKTEFISRINSHAKLSSYIQEIKTQSQIIDQVEHNRMTDRIDSLLSQIEENQIQLNFFDALLDELKVKLECLDLNDFDEKLCRIVTDITIAQSRIQYMSKDRNVPDKDFVRKLLNKHPNLTPQEIQLSFMLLLGYSSKEISAQTFRETSSVKVARSRLRKKLALETNNNLTIYLQQFS